MDYYWYYPVTHSFDTFVYENITDELNEAIRDTDDVDMKHHLALIVVDLDRFTEDDEPDETEGWFWGLFS